MKEKINKALDFFKDRVYLNKRKKELKEILGHNINITV